LHVSNIASNIILDVPTSKFGDALRAQVEERLNFFETGAPPSKNSDAIRKVLDELALEDDDEDADEQMADAEPILTTLEPTPRKEKKKRKSDSMDVGEDDEGPSAKKVKLSKEEKKALKKTKKAEKEAKKAAAGVSVSVFVIQACLPYSHCYIPKKKKEKKEKEKKKA
jgi:nucleolar protein 56